MGINCNSEKNVSCKHFIFSLKGPKSETVRRNLFTDKGNSVAGVKLERRQSIAVMESTRRLRTTPRKSPRRQSARTPKGTFWIGCLLKIIKEYIREGKDYIFSSLYVAVHHILKTKVVVETPRHKQISRLSLGRSRSQTAPDVGVILESPDKITPSGGNAKGEYLK